MISTNDISDWYYSDEKSNIVGTVVERDLVGMFSPAISEIDRQQKLVKYIIRLNNSPILPELYMQIGLRYIRSDLPQVAKKYILRAKKVHSANALKQSCVQLLLGNIHYISGKRIEACHWWRAARATMAGYIRTLEMGVTETEQNIETMRLTFLDYSKLADWHRQKSKPEKEDRHRKKSKPEKEDSQEHEFISTNYDQMSSEWQNELTEKINAHETIKKQLNWYKSCLKKMGIDSFCTPEEAYLLVINYSTKDPYRLRKGYIKWRKLEHLIASKLNDRVDEAVDSLMKNSKARTPIAEADTNIICGWALSEGNKDDWEKFLKRAILLYPPDSPARVWARWLLGALQWQIPSRHEDGSENWSDAIQELTHLKNHAEWQNKKDMVNDYVDKLPLMQGALDLQRKRHK